MTAGYFIPPDDGGRDQMNWNPEWSRRPRGVVTYAALRSLGKEGIARIVSEGCRLAHRLVTGLGELPGVEVLSPARMNQGLVRFLDEGGDHDQRTDAVTEAIRDEGTAWFGATTWNGMRAMRISVCNFRTTDEDVDRTLEAVFEGPRPRALNSLPFAIHLLVSTSSRRSKKGREFMKRSTSVGHYFPERTHLSDFAQ